MRPSARGAALAGMLAGIAIARAAAGAAAPPSPATEAYAAGQEHLARRTVDDLREALQDFERATAADATFAPAFAGLAETQALLYDYPRAREAAQRALALDDRLATAHAVLGFVRLHADWDWAGAEVEFRRALELDPARAASHLWYSILLEATSRPDEAVKEARRAVELVPGDAHLQAGLGYRLYWARRYDEAVTELTAALKLDPDLATSHYFIGRCRLQQNRLDDARAAFLRARALSPRDANLLSAVGYLDALTGKRKEAERILAEMERLAHDGLPFDLQIAGIHAALGQKTMALDWLENALAAREGTLVWLKIDPWFESLRGEPRFAAILRALKLPG
jgi:tetratricopeptide (TPR) repeat protein